MTGVEEIVANEVETVAMVVTVPTRKEERATRNLTTIALSSVI